jgi:hypothetical protein
VEWVEANIVEDKMLEIDCEAFGEVHKFVIWLWDSINIYGLHNIYTWVTPMMCFRYLGVSIVMWDEIHGLACVHEFPTCTLVILVTKILTMFFVVIVENVQVYHIFSQKNDKSLDVGNQSWMQTNL